MKLNTTAKLLVAFFLAVIAQLLGRSFFPLLTRVVTRCFAVSQRAVRAFASLLEQFRREGELLRE